MNRKLLILAVVMVIALPAASQRRGGAGQSGRGAGPVQSQGGNAAGDAQQSRIRDLQRDRLHTQVSAQQRTQFQTCTQTMDRVRTHAQQMAKTGSAAFNPDAARQQRDQLRSQMRTMQQEHENLMRGLGLEQQSAIQNRARNMQQTQERISLRLQQMDRELAKQDPNGDAVSAQARFIEREMNNWRNQYRDMGNELGLND